jgi:hypothetical protein
MSVGIIGLKDRRKIAANGKWLYAVWIFEKLWLNPNSAAH